MRIRPLAASDLDSWCRMRRALWPDADAPELRVEAEAFLAAASPLEAVLVGEDSAGEPSGMIELSVRSYAEGCRTAPVPYIEAWYVVPQARRRGLGRALVLAAEAWARERGYREIASDTLLDNRVGERAHLALGFEEIERAIHFRKDLAAGTAAAPGSRSGEG